MESGTKLVARAGQTMDGIVSSVRRVSQIIGEISAAATEQSQGITQVNVAVSNLDQMTQQNAALVEESGLKGLLPSPESHRVHPRIVSQRGVNRAPARPG